MVLVAALVLSANTLSAQDGLFRCGAVTEEKGLGYFGQSQNGLLGRSGGPEGIINNQTFGAPLGSGAVILLAAGMGYALLNRKEDEQ